MERAKSLEQFPDQYFDPLRYMARGETAYREAVQRHFQIAAFAYSDCKDDPAFREILRLLLANGYGIDDFESVIKVLAFHKLETDAVRDRYEELGFFTEEKIEERLRQRGTLKHEEQSKKRWWRTFSPYRASPPRRCLMSGGTRTSACCRWVEAPLAEAA